MPTNVFADAMPRIQSPIEVQNGLAQGANAQMQFANNQLAFQDRQMALQRDAELRQAVQASGGDPVKMRQALVGSGNYAALDKHDQAQADLAEKTARAGKEKSQQSDFDSQTMLRQIQAAREQTNLMAQQLGAARGPEDVVPIYQQHMQSGFLDPQKAEASFGKMPKVAGPAWDAWKADQLKQGQTEQQRQQIALQQAQQAELARHNQAGEKTAQGNLAVAQGHLAVSRAAEGRAAAAPKGQVVQTDQGPMLVDPRDPASARPITGADGAPIRAPGPKVKDIPQPVVSGYINNQTALKKIDDAIAAVKANGNAIGLKNYAPDAIIQRTDPEGVKTRAIISDIGSLKIHDRTGAAMSAAESVRLNPFIPKATDSPETVVRKLEQMKAEYADKNSGMESYYNSDMGFKPITDIAVPRTPAAGPSGHPPEIADLLKKYGK